MENLSVSDSTFGPPQLNYDYYFYGTVCHVCKLRHESKQLKQCAACKLISYCSKEHQKMHWPIHKHLCKSIQIVKDISKINHIYDFDGGIKNCDPETLKEVKSKIMMVLNIYLKRELSHVEQQIITFPRICEVCHDYGKLIDCINCHSVSYCSEDHRDQHTPYHMQICHLFELTFRMDNTEYNLTSVSEINSAKVQIPLRVTAYPDNIIAVINKFSNMKTNPNMLDANTILKQFSVATMFSPISTIIHTLEITSVITNRVIAGTSLTIHVIGATTEAIYNFKPNCVEIITEWITNLHQITFVFIGPNASKEHLMEYEMRNRSRTKVKLESYQILYEDYISHKDFLKPDLIVAFNCGFHEYKDANNPDIDTWLKSIKYLVGFKTAPLCFTSYNKAEAEEDMKCVLKVKKARNVNVVINCVKNPHYDPRPLRDWEKLDCDIFYRNHFYSVVVPK